MLIVVSHGISESCTYLVVGFVLFATFFFFCFVFPTFLFLFLYNDALGLSF